MGEILLHAHLPLFGVQLGNGFPDRVAANVSRSDQIDPFVLLRGEVLSEPPIRHRPALDDHFGRTPSAWKSTARASLSSVMARSSRAGRLRPLAFRTWAI